MKSFVVCNGTILPSSAYLGLACPTWGWTLLEWLGALIAYIRSPSEGSESWRWACWYVPIHEGQLAV